jgi:hypothetical protein
LIRRTPPRHNHAFNTVALLAVPLERVQARYGLVGSLASSLQGEPRSTNDIDFFSTLSMESVSAFTQLSRAAQPRLEPARSSFSDLMTRFWARRDAGRTPALD